MIFFKKVSELKYLPLNYRWRLFIFHIKRVLAISFSPELYEINYFLNSHLIRYNGFLKLVRSNSYITHFKKFKNTNDKDILLTLRKLPSSDFKVFEQIMVKEEYKPLIDLLNDNFCLNEPLLVLDAGGNIGAFSVYLNAFCPNASFVIIEPDDGNYSILSENVSQNGLKVISLIKAGLWNSNTYLELFCDFRDNMEWSYRVKEVRYKTNLKAFSLETIMNIACVSSIDILKLDIEGAEAQIFSDFCSITKCLKKVRFIAIEIHDEFNCRTNITNILSRSGFRLFSNNETLFGFNEQFVN